MKEIIVRMTSEHVKVKGGTYVRDLIRCEGCKHYISDGGALMECEITEFLTMPDDFCSYGERSRR